MTKELKIAYLSNGILLEGVPSDEIVTGENRELVAIIDEFGNATGQIRVMECTLGTNKHKHGI